MAQVILSSIGTAIGGPIGGALGRLAGSLIDRAAIDALTPARVVGRNLLGLQLNSTAEGAPMACAFGRARLSGQIVWAANFKQKKIAALTGGGKGGPNIETYSYSLSFAVAVCEGPIDGFGQVWADGQAMDMTGVVMRTYLGEETQTVDPLIEAIEGTAPAYRGVAYVVFEDLVLDDYGARPPELSFEVFRRPVAPGGPPRLEDRLTGVCLIPGAGEFVLATETVLRRDGLTVSTAENVNNHRADMQLCDLSSGLPAAQASTGQQKAMLIWVILAHAALMSEQRGFAPVLLLDEPAVHLDAARRGALFESLLHLPAQAFLTGTDADIFHPLRGHAEFLSTGEGRLRALSDG